MSSLDDHDLVYGLKANNENYFGIFVDRYAGLLIAKAKDTGLPLQDARVAANEALYKAIKKIHLFDFNKGTSFKAWLIKIVENCAKDQLRIRQREFPFQSINDREDNEYQVSENIWQDAECPQSELDLLSKDILNEVLQGLSPVDQQILMDRACELSHKQISEQLDKSEGAVKVAHHRALKKLKEQYIVKLESLDDNQRKSELTSYLYGKKSEKTVN